MTSVSLPNSPIDIQLRLMWRLLRLVFWLSVVTALLYAVANVQRGHWVLALVDGVAVGAIASSYRVAIRLGRPELGIQAIAIISWLTLAVTITMQGGLRSPAIAWIVGSQLSFATASASALSFKFGFLPNHC